MVALAMDISKRRVTQISSRLARRPIAALAALLLAGFTPAQAQQSGDATATSSEAGRTAAATPLLPGWERVTGAESDGAEATARCSEGKKILGGGCAFSRGPDGTDSIWASYPSGADEWTCKATIVYGVRLTAYAICANGE